MTSSNLFSAIGHWRYYFWVDIFCGQKQICNDIARWVRINIIPIFIITIVFLQLMAKTSENLPVGFSTYYLFSWCSVKIRKRRRNLNETNRDRVFFFSSFPNSKLKDITSDYEWLSIFLCLICVSTMNLLYLLHCKSMLDDLR